MVRKRYVGEPLPTWNWYSVPGFKAVSSLRYTLKSVFGYGFVLVLPTCQTGLATAVFSAALSVAYRMDVSADVSGPTHCTVIVVVGSLCHDRNSVSRANCPSAGFAVSFDRAFWASSTGFQDKAAANPAMDDPRKWRRCSAGMTIPFHKERGWRAQMRKLFGSSGLYRGNMNGV